MRWIWIDRFLEFEPGRRAVAVKNVCQGEDFVDDYMPSFPMMPNTLIIEGIAQTGGLLVGETRNFDEKVVLAKIQKTNFHFHARPGDTLTYEVETTSLEGTGAMVSGISRVGDRIQGETEMLFAFLDDSQYQKTLFEPKNFVFTLKLMGVFDVGQASGSAEYEVPEAVRRLTALEGGRELI